MRSSPLICGLRFLNLRAEVVDRIDQSCFDLNFWLPVQQRARSGDVRPADFWIVGRQRSIHELAVRTGHSNDRLRDFLDRQLARVADVYRVMDAGQQQPDDSLDES